MNNKVYDIRTKRRKEQIKKWKKKKNDILLMLFTFLFIIGYLSITAVSLFMNPNNNKLRVTMLKMEDIIYSEGIIVRNEVTVKPNTSGDASYNYQDNEKVKKDDLIAVISDKNLNNIKRSRLNEINAEILKFQSQRKDLFLFKDSLVKLNTSFDKKIKYYYGKTFYGDNFEEIYALKKNMDDYLYGKVSLLSAESTDNTGYYIEKRRNFLNQIDANTESLVAPIGGVLSYYTDGFEDIYTKDTLSNIDLDDFKKSFANDVSDFSRINAGDNAFKIVDGFEWYLAGLVSNKDIDKFSVGQTKKLRLFGVRNETVKAQILDIKKYGEKSIVYYKLVSKIENFLNVRKVDFEVIENSYEGYKLPKKSVVKKTLLKIPTDCIVKIAKVRGVLKKIGNEPEFTPIDIVYSDEGYSYISSIGSQLRLGDYLVKKGATIEDTVVLNEVANVSGIYVINTNIARFKAIDIVLERDDYVLAKPNLLYSIKLYDQYVDDISKISEGKYVN
ncbi:MAG: hypothetical protein N4A47_00485 [Clostridia bacterium]|jgi:putative membrane fusion protein|nr:hypothetical protein [Clostridia bacterium]